MNLPAASPLTPAIRPSRPIKLYRTALSGHCHRVELLLSLIGLPYELVDIDMAKRTHKSPEFLAKNAFGQVPVIEDGDVTLADSNAILVYLEARYAPGQWLPRDPVQASAVQRWLSVAAGELTYGLHLARVITLFKRPADPADPIALAKALLEVMEGELKTRPFLTGERATLADVANYAYVALAPEGRVPLAPFPAIRAWLARIEALPGFVPMKRSAVEQAPGMGAPSGPDDGFHEGEQAIQARVGVRERMSEIGSRVIRSYMPEQHRQFFTQLPFLIVGTVDGAGQPWASALAGPAGFVTSPDPGQLAVRALPPTHDPLAQTLVPGASIGLLGLEPHTRRRNRMNGVVGQLDAQGFSVKVSQSFGNCPQYIQAREPEFLGADGGAAPALHRADQLDHAAMELIGQADTFYIATAHPAAHVHAGTVPNGPERARGVDVSHRGGKPGFVRVDGPGMLTVPDFSGNFFFNTLGNITIEPCAGLLFIDFLTGDLLQVSVRAEIIWDGAELAGFQGAERLLRLAVTGVRRMPAALPLRWGPATLSPVLARTGDW